MQRGEGDGDGGGGQAKGADTHRSESWVMTEVATTSARRASLIASSSCPTAWSLSRATSFRFPSATAFDQPRPTFD